MISAYPLTWPATMPRAKYREKSRFKVTLAAALDHVETSLRLFGRDSGRAVKDVVLSSNCTLGVSKPADPGVAAWFTWDGDQVCIAVDRYHSPAENLQAIHYVIEARRVEMRHGTLALVKATFRGFRALPAPPGAKTWRQVLELPTGVIPRSDVDAAYRRLASSAHPDKGGSHERMSELNRAREQGIEECK